MLDAEGPRARERERLARADSAPTIPTTPQHLSPEEVWRLTLFKWRYALEASGFTEREIRYLLFHKWRLSHA